MSTVFMRHPDLPPEQEYEAQPSQVPHLAASGWQPVPEEELAERRQQRAQAELQKLLDSASGAADAEHVPESSAGSEPPAETPTSEPARKRRRATPETSEES